jgi:hypothetical protein
VRFWAIFYGNLDLFLGIEASSNIYLRQTKKHLALAIEQKQKKKNQN